MDDSNSHLKKCPYCGEKIQKSAKKCRYCGEFLREYKVPPMKKKKKQGTLVGAIVCFVLAWYLMISSGWTFLLYIPLFIASFILTVVAMAAHKQIGGGIVMLLMLLFTPPIAFVWVINTVPIENEGNEGFDSSDSLKTYTEIAGESNLESNYIKNISLYDFESRYFDSILDGRKPGIWFKIRNNGERSLSMVRVTVFFKDRNDVTIFEKDLTVFNTNSIFGDDKPLKPGYIWQMERDRFLSIDNVPEEWQEGNTTIQITDVSFADTDE